MSCHSKYHEYGFNFKEISDFLAESSVSLGARHSPDPVTGYPEWAYELAPITSFTVNQTRVLMLGCNPFDDFYINDSQSKELAIAEHLLWDAIDNGKLISFKKTNGDDMLKQEDVRTWCESIGRAWCIPLPEKTNVKNEIVIQATNGGDVFLERLQQSERENAVLLEDNNQLSGDLTKALETITHQKQQLIDAAERLKVAIREQASFQAEFDILKADALEGKTKSTLLRIIGGIAMSGCGLVIHANRIDGISQAVNDLALMGVSIKEDTLRKHLKAAAELIPKPK